MLNNNKRAKLDKTSLVAQTSKSVPQSVTKSEAKPKDSNAVVNKSTRPHYIPKLDSNIKTLL